MGSSKHCPNCGSSDIEPDIDGLLKGRENPGDWICNNCGYTGFMPEGEKGEADGDELEGVFPQRIQGTDRTQVVLTLIFTVGIPAIIITLLIYSL